MPEAENTKFDSAHPYHRKPETERRPYFCFLSSWSALEIIALSSDVIAKINSFMVKAARMERAALGPMP